MKTVIEMAHRTCWRYKKSTDPHHSDTYTFNDHTLKAFADSIREDAIDKFNRQMNQVCEEARLLDDGEKQQEPVAWQPIETLKPTSDELDILMGDGSILCNVLTQSDGDLWWDGSGTGEKFIDPKHSDVTHWRKHSDTTPPTAAQAARQMRDSVFTALLAAETPYTQMTMMQKKVFGDAIAALPVPEVQWRDLTDAEIDECDWGQCEQDHARAVITKFKEKNK